MDIVGRKPGAALHRSLRWELAKGELGGHSRLLLWETISKAVTAPPLFCGCFPHGPAWLTVLTFAVTVLLPLVL